MYKKTPDFFLQGRYNTVKKYSYLSEPEVEILDGCDEGALAVGLLQLHRLLAGLLGEELPLLCDALQTVLHRLLATAALLPTIRRQ